MAKYEKLPEDCNHVLLSRVDQMSEWSRPPECHGALQPFMQCYECGAILYLLRAGPLGTEIYPSSDS